MITKKVLEKQELMEQIDKCPICEQQGDLIIKADIKVFKCKNDKCNSVWSVK